MSALTVAWSMVAAACLTLALAQLFVWSRQWKTFDHVLASLMCVGAAGSAWCELALMRVTSVADFGRLLQWDNLFVYLLLVPMVWYVQLRFGSARRWLALLITALWTIALVPNFMSPYSVVFSEITELQHAPTFWGESFAQAVGTSNPWVTLTNVASLLILVYVVDASIHDWRSGQRRGMLVSASICLFMIVAGVHAPLVDASALQTPYMISFAFLAIVFALAYELLDSARLSIAVQQERAQALADAQAAREAFARVERVSLLGELAGGIAHELNQPLAAILANAQTARKLLSVPEPDHELLRDIVEDIIGDDKRAADVIHRLRELLQKKAPMREPVALHDLVRDTVQLLHGELQAGGIQVKIESDAPRLVVQGDRVGLQQVLINLILNAVNAMRNLHGVQREVIVRLGRRDKQSLISVIDCGHGISAEVMPRLFDSFYTTADEGLGMGLAICRRIVQLHAGTIEGRNRDSGGAEFRIALPLAQDHV